jgi:hypothetical protein
MAQIICSICKRPFYGYGNNAQPVNNGRCCGECNDMVVIPARMIDMGISFNSEKRKEDDNGVV